MAEYQNLNAPKNADSKNEQDAKSREQEILKTARKRYKLAEDEWHDVYQKARADQKALLGGEHQWDEQILKTRKLENRPSFSVNTLPQPVKQVVNDQKQNKPSIRLAPVDNLADPDTATIFQGLIKNIENVSDAPGAYTHALYCSAGCSIGFFEIRTEFASPYSFKVVPRIYRIADPLSVLVDPYFKEKDGRDLNWGFKSCTYSKDDYKEEFGDSKLGEANEWKDFISESQGWVSPDSVRVTEYYCKEYKPIELVQLSDGQAYDKADLSEENWPVDEMGQPLQVLDERKDKKCVVKHYKLNGIEILEETEFPAPYIPLIPVLGEEIWVDGKRELKSLIRDAIPSQQLKNLWISSEAENIGLMPKAPYIAAIGQITKELEPMWRTANQRTHAYLLYNPADVQGRLLPPPQRTFSEPNVQAITNARLQANEDIKATTGVYDAALGAQSNEKSGIAIERRTSQAQTSNYHFVDNLNSAIRHGGVILTEVIPHLFDVEETIRIIGEEGEDQEVTINKVLEDGKKIDFSVGKYDVVVETGPNFATRRQEAQAMLIEFMKVVPQHAAALADLVAENSDWPGKGALVERLRKLLPPGLAEEKGKENPIPPEVQAQMQQQGQLIEQLTQQLNQAAEEIKIKKYEVDARVKIEAMKLETQAAIKHAELESKEGLEMLKLQRAELDRISKIPLEIEEQEFNEQMPPDQQQMPEQQNPLMEGQ